MNSEQNTAAARRWFRYMQKLLDEERHILRAGVRHRLNPFLSAEWDCSFQEQGLQVIEPSFQQLCSSPGLPFFFFTPFLLLIVGLVDSSG